MAGAGSHRNIRRADPGTCTERNMTQWRHGTKSVCSKAPPAAGGDCDFGPPVCRFPLTLESPKEGHTSCFFPSPLPHLAAPVLIDPDRALRSPVRLHCADQLARAHAVSERGVGQNAKPPPTQPTSPCLSKRYWRRQRNARKKGKERHKSSGQRKPQRE